MRLDEALRARRSVRSMTGKPIAAGDLDQIIWAAQGRRGEDGSRTCPSAGAAYPLKLRVLVFAVEGRRAGLSEYDPVADRLVDMPPIEGMVSTAGEMAAAALGLQAWIADASAVITILGEPAKLARPFEDQPPAGRWLRYLWIECGAAAQNAALAAAERGLAMTAVAGFDDRHVAALNGAGDRDEPLAMLVLGQMRLIG
ncbi:MAG: nitroreductase family protein [Gammaproteobacteria bacterium]|nr:nitroreductase family protein [Gammaproteobacteria bacterium]